MEKADSQSGSRKPQYTLVKLSLLEKDNLGIHFLPLTNIRIMDNLVIILKALVSSSL